VPQRPCAPGCAQIPSNEDFSSGLVGVPGLARVAGAFVLVGSGFRAVCVYDLSGQVRKLLM